MHYISCVNPSSFTMKHGLENRLVFHADSVQLLQQTINLLRNKFYSLYYRAEFLMYVYGKNYYKILIVNYTRFETFRLYLESNNFFLRTEKGTAQNYQTTSDSQFHLIKILVIWTSLGAYFGVYYWAQAYLACCINLRLPRTNGKIVIFRKINITEQPTVVLLLSHLI